MSLLDEISGDDVLDAAYEWLCHRRRDYPAHADIWNFRRRWPQQRQHLQERLRQGRYRFSVLARVTTSKGDNIHLWSASDALVLKALAMVLARHLPVAACCTHVKGHGGAKGAVRQVIRYLPHNRFVARTDVAAYYDSIDHDRLLDLLAVHIEDPCVLNLLGQYLRYSTERGGIFTDNRHGISRGCPLSPLMGAFFLNALDDTMKRPGIFYVRFMDDIVVLAKTRWKLRSAVADLNAVLSDLGLSKHPDKTFIGRIERGFDFLGYHFSARGVRVSSATLARFLERAARLYEQGPWEPGGLLRACSFVRRWMGWASGGLAGPAGTT
jgi:hypothetical protein